jgi:branched-chain amino acid transport system permease protein
VQGVLLGCFYAAVSIGLSVAFGLLDVPHIAHPAFVVLGSYGTWLVAGRYGWDPLVSGVALAPVFFLVGVAVYRFYYETFEKRGTDTGVRGLAFFFGVAFIIEVGLIIGFGVDQRLVDAPYIGRSLELGEEMRLPMRMLVAFGTALVLTALLGLYLSRTFTGRAIKAVAQDEPALRLMGANPVRIKQWAFGIATAVASIAGALLIIVGPVEPSMDRVYIGRTFCVVVLAGLGSMSGTLVAGLILGISESIVLTLLGASWAPAVSFGLLLLVLGVRPQGLFGR